MGQFNLFPIPLLAFLVLLPLTKGLFFFFSLSPQTAEHLTLASLGKSPNEEPAPGGDREKSTFQEDESLPAVFRAKLLDYFRSGYDRGHMCVCFHYITTQSFMIRVAFTLLC
jgi:DNA/RNA non-specific endonuclease